MRALAIYGCVVLLALGLLFSESRLDVASLALGLIVPGGGFLAWAGPENPLQILAIGLFGVSLLTFLVALAVWFATGNVLLPLAAWLIAALGAGSAVHWSEAAGDFWQPAMGSVPLGAVCGLGLAGAVSHYVGRRGLRRRARLNAYLRSAEAKSVVACHQPNTVAGELSRQDLQLMRLILDRALQPRESFEGFEWADQFQTAAVRYQLNFMSYALSICQREQLPAFHGYLRTAQENLVAKQQDHRIWRYWLLENLWGNLRLNADPIPRDNIMLSGFLAAQIAYHQATSGPRAFDEPSTLVFEHPSGQRFTYTFSELIDVLVRQYETADYGLLACEPNWIYPLCNAITASAIRACDGLNKTSIWPQIESSFRRHLESEFITAGGRFIPFRSSYSGIAAPMIGGAVNQAFPCYFLSAVLPDIAARQWQVLHHDLAGKDWRRAMWPVDVGNYRLSRASSCAATAAAAVELGDSDVATRLLGHLDEECPLTLSGNVAHRPKASLWAHAVELMARCGRAGSLRSLADAPRVSAISGPIITEADYPDVLVARAVNAGGGLHAVLYPGEQAGIKALRLGGLVPEQSYDGIAAGFACQFKASSAGEARLELPLEGRTELKIERTA